MLAVLHDLNLAAQYAVQILVMKASQVLAAGTPNAVLTPEVVHGAFNMAVLIEQYPCLNYPLVIAIPQTSKEH